MKITKPVLISLVLLILVSALYRVIPGRPPGFAPQLAMTVFSGALFIKNKKWAFFLPIFSMLISDLFYQVLFISGLSGTAGFYDGQWQNYLLFGGLTTIGFLMNRITIGRVMLASIASPTIYFLLSNFLVWASGSGLGRPITGSGLLLCYNDGLPFYINSLYGTAFFSAVLFGSYFLIKNYRLQPKTISR